MCVCMCEINFQSRFYILSKVMGPCAPIWCLGQALIGLCLKGLLAHLLRPLSWACGCWDQCAQASLPMSPGAGLGVQGSLSESSATWSFWAWLICPRGCQHRPCPLWDFRPFLTAAEAKAISVQPAAGRPALCLAVEADFQSSLCALGLWALPVFSVGV